LKYSFACGLEELVAWHLVGKRRIKAHLWERGGLHLELGKQWKVTIFYEFYVKRRVCIFITKNLYGNNTRKLCI
jgi:hypothetical protein